MTFINPTLPDIAISLIVFAAIFAVIKIITFITNKINTK